MCVCVRARVCVCKQTQKIQMNYTGPLFIKSFLKIILQIRYHFTAMNDIRYFYH